MGILGDILGEFLGGATGATGGVNERQWGGQRLKTTDIPFKQFYEKVYFDFGLTPPRHLKDGEFVPIQVGTVSGKIYRFEIRGNITSPERFLSGGYGGVFQKISRDMPTTRNQVWAFDITRLHEGILSGETTWESNADYAQSEEYLNVLRLVGGGVGKPLSKAPAIHLGFGDIWARFGVPDRIAVGVESMYPFSDADMKRIINLILHNYRNANSSLEALYSWDDMAGTFEIITKEKSPVSHPQPEPEQTQPNASTPQSEPTDGFPYEFYRGLGLIDDENNVTMPSIFGAEFPMTVPMENVLAKEFLLAYKP